MFVYNWHNYVGFLLIIHTNGIINKRMVRFNPLLLQPTGDLMCFTDQHFAPTASADPEWGTGGPDPPGKSQVIWVSIGNKQLDPRPPPGKSLTPPLLENARPPHEP